MKLPNLPRTGQKNWSLGQGLDIRAMWDDLVRAINDILGMIPPGGTSAPTQSAQSNLTASTVSAANYYIVNGMVTVFGKFTADPTAAATVTSFEMSLPVPSNLGADSDLAGVAFSPTVAGQGAAIFGVPANDTAKVQWISGDVTDQPWYYQFSYRIL